MTAPEWARIFWKDLQQKEFIPLKILFFLAFGASMALFPFLTIHARSLGVTEQELGVVYAFNPIVSLAGPPLTGLMADKLGNFKVLLSFLMTLTGLAGLLFAAIPAARIVHPLPELLPYTLTCNPNPLHKKLIENVSMVKLSLDEPNSCDYIDGKWTKYATITNCSLCGRSWYNSKDSKSCTTLNDNRQACKAANMLGSQLSLSLEVSPNDSSSLENISKLTTNNWDCPNLTTDILYNEHMKSSSWQDHWSCQLECQILVQRGRLCSNDKTVVEMDTTATFWIFLLVRLLNGLTLATSFTLLDGATIAILKEHGGDFGLQRLYGNLGAVIMSPLTGYLIDTYSHENGQANFLPAFIVYCILKIIAAIVILFANLDFRKPSESVVKDFKYIIRQPEILAFLMVMFLSGVLYGYVDTFLFWLLQDLGANKSLMGITVTVGSISGIPILICSHYIIRGIGYANTIILGFGFYSIRMIGYSFLSNPWWAMPFELLECFTNSLMSTAAASYAGDLATPTTIATLQGLYGGLHHGVGRGTGGLIGGFLASVFDIHIIFRIMAAACAIICIVYFIVNYVFFQKLQNERRKLKEEEKNSKENILNDSTINDLHMNNFDSKISALDNPAFTMETEKSNSMKNGFVGRNGILGLTYKVEDKS